MTWPRRLEVGVVGGLAVALAVVGWIVWHEPRPKPRPKGPPIYCSYVGEKGTGYITVAANGDLTFEAPESTLPVRRFVIVAREYPTIGDVLDRVNRPETDWRCLVYGDLGIETETVE